MKKDDFSRFVDKKLPEPKGYSKKLALKEAAKAYVNKGNVALFAAATWLGVTFLGPVLAGAALWAAGTALGLATLSVVKTVGEAIKIPFGGRPSRASQIIDLENYQNNKDKGLRSISSKIRMSLGMTLANLLTVGYAQKYFDIRGAAASTYVDELKTHKKYKEKYVSNLRKRLLIKNGIKPEVVDEELAEYKRLKAEQDLSEKDANRLKEYEKYFQTSDDTLESLHKQVEVDVLEEEVLEHQNDIKQSELAARDIYLEANQNKLNAKQTAELQDISDKMKRLQSLIENKQRLLDEKKSSLDEETLDIDGIETPPNPNKNADPEAGPQPRTEHNPEAKAGNEPPSKRPRTTGRSIMDKDEKPASKEKLPEDGGAIKFDRSGIPADALSVSAKSIAMASASTFNGANVITTGSLGDLKNPVSFERKSVEVKPESNPFDGVADRLKAAGAVKHPKKPVMKMSHKWTIPGSQM
ncbi:MAG: hypothetical protein CMH30_01145 [Micavibrio sp.]|mgnify:CR=1 FL=1|nr:hypothetical protein [Micavibrio sp.]|tara:strand:+ start:6859 stop:8265 length:1407 start_codon:yes stop_codon:yes gene_type:complete